MSAPSAKVFGDGRQTRDFVYVADVVAAFLAAGSREPMGRSTSVPGAETSVLDLVHLLELVTSHDTMRVGEVRRSCLDPTAAFEQLAWRSSTPLAQGLRSTLDWAHGCRPAARAGFSTA